MSEARIAYQAHGDEGGDGPPVVLLHGAAGTHLSWPAQVRYLPGCRVYALDLPGHGKSGGEPCRSIEDYARRVGHLDGSPRIEPGSAGGALDGQRDCHAGCIGPNPTG